MAEERSVTVSAVGKSAAVPDLVTVSIGVQVRAGTAREALSRANEQVQTVITTFKDGGVAARDIATTDVSIWPQYADDGRRVEAYQASNTLSVEVSSKPGSWVRISIATDESQQPKIVAAISPQPNAAGWNRADTTVSFTCTAAAPPGRGAPSSIVSCTAPVKVTTEGARQVVSGTATDSRGNTVGINVTRERLKITALSSGMCALGGAIFAQYQMYIGPDTIAGLGLSLNMVFAVIAADAIEPVLFEVLTTSPPGVAVILTVSASATSQVSVVVAPSATVIGLAANELIVGLSPPGQPVSRARAVSARAFRNTGGP